MSHSLIIGFVPLLDCAPLVAAAELGFADAEGLSLQLIRETSWANIRDRLMVRQFDAAHLLGPMAVASTLGIGGFTAPVIAPMALGLGGNAITVSESLWQGMQQHGAQLGATPAIQGKALRALLTTRGTQAPLKLGMVYPFSCHNYELRYWLAAVGIDPDHDVELTVIPPPLLVEALRAGEIDGFCAGDPWNSLAVAAGVGVIVTTTQAIWRLSPEKVLGCRSDWAANHPEQLLSLMRAVVRAAHWVAQPANHESVARLLAQPRFIGAPAELLHHSLSGRLRMQAGHAAISCADFYLPAQHMATFPWASHALWFYAQMVRWQQTTLSDAGLDAARAAYRPDLYRHAVAGMLLEGEPVPVPMTDFKTERTTELPFVLPAAAGLHLSAEGFFDERVFEPIAVADYLRGFTL